MYVVNQHQRLTHEENSHGLRRMIKGPPKIIIVLEAIMMSLIGSI